MKARNIVPILLCAFPTALYADFNYTDTTQITGGTIVGLMKTLGVFSKQARQIGDPIVSTVSIKGNRMVRINPQHTEIIDLDSETITNIDNEKKTYTTMTFQQMKQQLDAAAKRAQQQKQSDPQAADTDVSFDVKVRNTGEAKDVAGVSTNGAILSMLMNATDKKSGQTGSLAVTNDMYLAPEVPGYSEVRDFQRRFAEKLGTVLGSGGISSAMLSTQQPGSGKALADMTKEMSKLKGVPVQQVMRMGSTTDGKPLPAASEAPLPQNNTQTPSAGQIAKDSIVNSLGFGGFGKKKKADQPASDDSKAAANGQPTFAVLIESNTQISGFSQAPVDPAKFAIPAGYKQVEAKLDSGN